MDRPLSLACPWCQAIVTREMPACPECGHDIRVNIHERPLTGEERLLAVRDARASVIATVIYGAIVNVVAQGAMAFVGATQPETILWPAQAFFAIWNGMLLTIAVRRGLEARRFRDRPELQAIRVAGPMRLRRAWRYVGGQANAPIDSVAIGGREFRFSDRPYHGLLAALGSPTRATVTALGSDPRTIVEIRNAEGRLVYLHPRSSRHTGRPAAPTGGSGGRRSSR